VPASVSVNVPALNSNAASPRAFDAFARSFVPVQPSGDHQMQDQPQVVFEPKQIRLPSRRSSTTSYLRHWTAAARPYAAETDLLHATRFENGALDSFLESLDIDDDVRQFRHYTLKFLSDCTAAPHHSPNPEHDDRAKYRQQESGGRKPRLPRRAQIAQLTKPPRIEPTIPNSMVAIIPIGSRPA
jgi:hypothetical protein